MNSLLEALLAAHFILAIVNIYDLLKRSKRSNKLLWAIAIAVFPVFGVLFYHQTKQRRRHWS